MTAASPDFTRLVPEHIRRFEAYVPSKPDDELKKLYGCEVLHRLHNNENPLGAPAASREVLNASWRDRTALYPSGDSYYLRHALAERFGKHPDQFLVGNGSCEVIASVVKAFCQTGDNIVTADRTFAVYEWVAEFSGFDARLIPLRDFGFDDQAMLERVDLNTKVIFVCNPNNPTGTYWDRDRMIRFLERVSNRCIVVIDEAYFEYVEKENFPDGMQLMEQYPNVVVFRTFSKMYGLAALRVGYLAASREMVDYIRRASVAYSVNTLAQAAATKAVRHGTEHILATREVTGCSKALVRQMAGSLGLPCQSGEGNYVMVRVPVNDTLFCRRMMRRGFMVRSMTGFRFPNWIRVSLAGPDVMQRFVDAFSDEIKADPQA